MSNEEKIQELESRLEKLEKIERRRRIKNIIVLCIYGAIVLTIIVTMIVVYYKLKPYKQKLDNLKNLTGSKIDDIVDGTDGYDYFGGQDPFSGFDFFSDFFN